MATGSHNLLCLTRNTVLLDQVNATFERKGYRLEAAHTESGAIALLSGGDYDALLLDVAGMTHQDITLLFARLREHWHGPMVALIPKHAHGEVVKAYEVGADSHIVVPFDSRELQARVEAILRRVRERKPGPKE